MFHFDQSSAVDIDAVAYDLWVRRGKPWQDGKADWLAAERIALEKMRLSVEKRAFHLWEKRGQPSAAAEKHWNEAELETRWENWSQCKLRPYLAVWCGKDPNRLASTLNERAFLNGDTKQATGMLIVLDGAPEFSRHVFQGRAGNGIEPEKKIEMRDGAFFRLAYNVALLCSGKVLGSGETGGMVPVGTREFQDGCVVQFARPEDALNAALTIRRTLDQENDRRNLPWYSQFHARIVVGQDWRNIVARLPRTYRDEIRVARETMSGMSQPIQEICYSAGVVAEEPGEEMEHGLGYPELSEISKGVRLHRTRSVSDTNSVAIDGTK